jgi:CheY-like chemotaxis protein
LTKGRILIVDDHELDRRLSTLDLEAAGYRVWEAGNANEAADLLAQQSFDLLVLDIVMPGIDGLTFLKELRRNQRTQKVPVIMLTARDEVDDELGAMADGAVSYIIKPSHRDVLVKSVAEVLAKAGHAPPRHEEQP